MKLFSFTLLCSAFLVSALMPIEPARAWGYYTRFHTNDPAFDWLEYLAANPDLPAAGIANEYMAYQHWMNHGRYECRRSSKSFNPAIYLGIYPDLQNAFGSSCSEAINHYGRHGIYEGRIAMYPNSTFGGVVAGTAVFGNEKMRLSASRRTAGAIDSLVFGGKEFINAYDHGRQISVAYRNDTFVSGECDNPTEPGSADDGLKASSTTHIFRLDANMNGTLATQVAPAFWTNPWQTTPDGCKTGPRNDGRYQAFDQILDKQVQVGYKGDPHVIVFDISVNNQRQDVPSFQIEAPTGYLTHEFTRYSKLLGDGNAQTFDIASLGINNYGSMQFAGGEQVEPGIISTPDGQYAMGAYSPNHYGVDPTYALYSFVDYNNQASTTNKWSIVFRLGRLEMKQYYFRSYVVVGTIDEVRSRLHWLRNGW